MTGGLLQILYYGNQDKILMENPNLTFFKSVYRKSTLFSIEQNIKPLNINKFGSINRCDVSNYGDLLQSLDLKVDLPNIKFEYDKELVNIIGDLVKTDPIYSNNIDNIEYNLNVLNTLEYLLYFNSISLIRKNDITDSKINNYNKILIENKSEEKKYIILKGDTPESLSFDQIHQKISLRNVLKYNTNKTITNTFDQVLDNNYVLDELDKYLDNNNGVISNNNNIEDLYIESSNINNLQLNVSELICENFQIYILLNSLIKNLTLFYKKPEYSNYVNKKISLYDNVFNNFITNLNSAIIKSNNIYEYNKIISTPVNDIRNITFNNINYYIITTDALLYDFPFIIITDNTTYKNINTLNIKKILHVDNIITSQFSTIYCTELDNLYDDIDVNCFITCADNVNDVLDYSKLHSIIYSSLFENIIDRTSIYNNISFNDYIIIQINGNHTSKFIKNKLLYVFSERLTDKSYNFYFNKINNDQSVFPIAVFKIYNSTFINDLEKTEIIVEKIDNSGIVSTGDYMYINNKLVKQIINVADKTVNSDIVNNYKGYIESINNSVNNSTLLISLDSVLQYSIKNNPLYLSNLYKQLFNIANNVVDIFQMYVDTTTNIFSAPTIYGNSENKNTVQFVADNFTKLYDNFTQSIDDSDTYNYLQSNIKLSLNTFLSEIKKLNSSFSNTFYTLSNTELLSYFSQITKYTSTNTTTPIITNILLKDTFNHDFTYLEKINDNNNSFINEYSNKWKIKTNKYTINTYLNDKNISISSSDYDNNINFIGDTVNINLKNITYIAHEHNLFIVDNNEQIYIGNKPVFDFNNLENNCIDVVKSNLLFSNNYKSQSIILNQDNKLKECIFDSENKFVIINDKIYYITKTGDILEYLNDYVYSSISNIFSYYNNEDLQYYIIGNYNNRKTIINLENIEKNFELNTSTISKNVNLLNINKCYYINNYYYFIDIVSDIKSIYINNYDNTKSEIIDLNFINIENDNISEYTILEIYNVNLNRIDESNVLLTVIYLTNNRSQYIITNYILKNIDGQFSLSYDSEETTSIEEILPINIQYEYKNTINNTIAIYINSVKYNNNTLLTTNFPINKIYYNDLLFFVFSLSNQLVRIYNRSDFDKYYDLTFSDVIDVFLYDSDLYLIDQNNNIIIYTISLTQNVITCIKINEYMIDSVYGSVKILIPITNKDLNVITIKNNILAKIYNIDLETDEINDITLNHTLFSYNYINEQIKTNFLNDMFFVTDLGLNRIINASYSLVNNKFIFLESSISSIIFVYKTDHIFKNITGNNVNKNNFKLSTENTFIISNDQYIYVYKYTNSGSESLLFQREVASYNLLTYKQLNVLLNDTNKLPNDFIVTENNKLYGLFKDSSKYYLLDILNILNYDDNNESSIEIINTFIFNKTTGYEENKIKMYTDNKYLYFSTLFKNNNNNNENSIIYYYNLDINDQNQTLSNKIIGNWNLNSINNYIIPYNIKKLYFKNITKIETLNDINYLFIDSNKLYYVIGNLIYRLDTSNEKSGDIISVASTKNYFYVLVLNNNYYYVIKYNFNILEKTAEIYEICQNTNDLGDILNLAEAFYSIDDLLIFYDQNKIYSLKLYYDQSDATYKLINTELSIGTINSDIKRVYFSNNLMLVMFENNIINFYSFKILNNNIVLDTGVNLKTGIYAEPYKNIIDISSDILSASTNYRQNSLINYPSDLYIYEKEGTFLEIIVGQYSSDLNRVSLEKVNNSDKYYKLVYDFSIVTGYYSKDVRNNINQNTLFIVTNTLENIYYFKKVDSFNITLNNSDSGLDTINIVNDVPNDYNYYIYKINYNTITYLPSANNAINYNILLPNDYNKIIKINNNIITLINSYVSSIIIDDISINYNYYIECPVFDNFINISNNTILQYKYNDTYFNIKLEKCSIISDSSKTGFTGNYVIKKLVTNELYDIKTDTISTKCNVQYDSLENDLSDRSMIQNLNIIIVYNIIGSNLGTINKYGFIKIDNDWVSCKFENNKLKVFYKNILPLQNRIEYTSDDSLSISYYLGEVSFINLYNFDQLYKIQSLGIEQFNENNFFNGNIFILDYINYLYTNIKILQNPDPVNPIDIYKNLDECRKIFCDLFIKLCKVIQNNDYNILQNVENVYETGSKTNTSSSILFLFKISNSFNSMYSYKVIHNYLFDNIINNYLTDFKYSMENMFNDASDTIIQQIKIVTNKNNNKDYIDWLALHDHTLNTYPKYLYTYLKQLINMSSQKLLYTDFIDLTINDNIFYLLNNITNLKSAYDELKETYILVDWKIIMLCITNLYQGMNGIYKILHGKLISINGMKYFFLNEHYIIPIIKYDNITEYLNLLTDVTVLDTLMYYFQDIYSKYQYFEVLNYMQNSSDLYYNFVQEIFSIEKLGLDTYKKTSEISMLYNCDIKNLIKNKDYLPTSNYDPYILQLTHSLYNYDKIDEYLIEENAVSNTLLNYYKNNKNILNLAQMDRNTVFNKYNKYLDNNYTTLLTDYELNANKNVVITVNKIGNIKIDNNISILINGNYKIFKVKQIDYENNKLIFYQTMDTLEFVTSDKDKIIKLDYDVFNVNYEKSIYSSVYIKNAIAYNIFGNYFETINNYNYKLNSNNHWFYIDNTINKYKYFTKFRTNNLSDIDYNTASTSYNKIILNNVDKTYKINDISILKNVFEKTFSIENDELTIDNIILKLSSLVYDEFYNGNLYLKSNILNFILINYLINKNFLDDKSINTYNINHIINVYKNNNMDIDIETLMSNINSSSKKEYDNYYEYNEYDMICLDNTLLTSDIKYGFVTCNNISYEYLSPYNNTNQNTNFKLNVELNNKSCTIKEKINDVIANLLNIKKNYSNVDDMNYQFDSIILFNHAKNYIAKDIVNKLLLNNNLDKITIYNPYFYNENNANKNIYYNNTLIDNNERAGYFRLKYQQLIIWYMLYIISNKDSYTYDYYRRLSENYNNNFNYDISAKLNNTELSNVINNLKNFVNDVITNNNYDIVDYVNENNIENVLNKYLNYINTYLAINDSKNEFNYKSNMISPVTRTYMAYQIFKYLFSINYNFTTNDQYIIFTTNNKNKYSTNYNYINFTKNQINYLRNVFYKEKTFNISSWSKKIDDVFIYNLCNIIGLDQIIKNNNIYGSSDVLMLNILKILEYQTIIINDNKMKTINYILGMLINNNSNYVETYFKNNSITLIPYETLFLTNGRLIRTTDLPNNFYYIKETINNVEYLKIKDVEYVSETNVMSNVNMILNQVSNTVSYYDKKYIDQLNSIYFVNNDPSNIYKNGLIIPNIDQTYYYQILNITKNIIKINNSYVNNDDVGKYITIESNFNDLIENTYFYITINGTNYYYYIDTIVYNSIIDSTFIYINENLSDDLVNINNELSTVTIYGGLYNILNAQMSSDQYNYLYSIRIIEYYNNSDLLLDEINKYILSFNSSYYSKLFMKKNIYNIDIVDFMMDLLNTFFINISKTNKNNIIEIDKITDYISTTNDITSSINMFLKVKNLKSDINYMYKSVYTLKNTNVIKSLEYVKEPYNVYYPKNPIGSCIKYFGHYLIDYVNFYIGDELIHSITDDYLNIYYNTIMNNNIKNKYLKYIGYDEDMVNDKNIIKKRSIYLMLPWFFNKKGMQLPLISLINTNVSIKIKLKPIDKLLNLDYNIKPIFVDDNGHKINDEISVYAMANYIYLDEEERQLFATKRHEYLIEQNQYFTTPFFNKRSLASGKINIKLNLQNNIKDIFIFGQISNNINLKDFANYTINESKFDSVTNYLLNLNRIPKNTNIYNMIKNVYNRTVIKFKILSEQIKLENINTSWFTNDEIVVLKELIKNIEEYDGNNVIKDIKMTINGKEIINLPTSYMSLVNIYKKYNKSSNNGINVHSFSLYPLENQPSGSLNFSVLNDIELDMHVDDNILNTDDFMIKIIGRGYNILRIFSGMGACVF